jgi:hypothetical protein
MPISRVVQRYKDFDTFQALPVLPKVRCPRRVAHGSMRSGQPHRLRWRASQVLYVLPRCHSKEAGGGRANPRAAERVAEEHCRPGREGDADRWREALRRVGYCRHPRASGESLRPARGLALFRHAIILLLRYRG